MLSWRRTWGTVVAKTKEEIASYKAAWYQANKEKMAARQLVYRKKNAAKIKDYQAEYRRKHKEDASVYKAEWYQRNKEKVLVSQKIYYTENVEEIGAKNAIYRAENKTKIAKRDASYAKANPDKRAAIVARYKLRKSMRCPKWLTKEQHKEITAFYTQAAVTSSFTGVQHHVDHIRPLQGDNISGLHVPWNLQVLSASDNCSKSNKFDLELQR